MFRIRPSRPEDAAQVLAVAAHLDTVNLPADRATIEGILERSRQSFAGEVPAAERELLFVLEDLGAGQIIGTSIIYAQHGSKRAPHIFFRVEPDERYSYTLDRYFKHQTLRIGYDYEGPTEIGGLILLPQYRGNAEALGKALSYVRFLYIRMHRADFRDEVLSELLPLLEPDGTSLLWEHLGRHFTGSSYQEADRLSKDNKEFIHALFPDDPIHTELLPEAVRAIIGQVGPATRGVEKMLRRVGFEYARQIDPFDGGPHFVAKTDAISIVRDARRVRVRPVEDADAERPWAILAVERAAGDAGPPLVATGARVIPIELPTEPGVDGGEIGITEDTRRRAVEVSPGDELWMAMGQAAAALAIAVTAAGCAEVARATRARAGRRRRARAGHGAAGWRSAAGGGLPRRPRARSAITAPAPRSSATAIPPPAATPSGSSTRPPAPAASRPSTAGSSARSRRWASPRCPGSPPASSRRSTSLSAPWPAPSRCGSPASTAAAPGWRRWRASTARASPATARRRARPCAARWRRDQPGAGAAGDRGAGPRRRR
ncbi:MAG: arginine N-succinyltransferase [Kofleriaceae bacterium]